MHRNDRPYTFLYQDDMRTALSNGLESFMHQYLYEFIRWYRPDLGMNFYSLEAKD
jgi:hypothetical protein